MDNHVRRISELTMHFYFDNYIRALETITYGNLETQDIVAFIRAKGAIRNYRVDLSFPGQYFVVFPDSGVVLGPNFVLGDLGFFYRSFFHYEAFTYEEWLAELRQNVAATAWPMQTVIINSNTRQMLTYLRPLSNLSPSSGIALFLVDENELSSILGIQTNPDVSVYIIDRYNQPVYQSGVPISDELIDRISRSTGAGWFLHDYPGGGRHLAVYSVSGLNGWKYISSTPVQIVLGDLENIRTISIAAALVVFVVGIMLALIIAYNNSSPLQKIFQLLGESMKLEEKLTLMTLEDSVSKLVSENKYINADNAKQAEILQALYIERLLNGGGPLEERDQEYLQNIEAFREPGLWYCCLIIQAGDSHLHTGGIKILSENVLSLLDIFLKSYLLHSRGGNELAVILCGENESFLQKAVVAYSDKMKDYLDREEIPYIIGVGTPAAEISGIRESYRMALFAVQYAATKSRGGGHLIVFSDSIASTDAFLYSPQVELQLMSNIKSGNANATEHVLNDIYTSNFEENTLRPHIVKYLIYNLYCTLLKVSHPLFVSGADEDFSVLLEHNGGDYTAVFYKLRSSLIQVANQYEDRKKSRNTPLIQSIVKYLEEHYTDPNLDALRVSEELQISEGYLSQFFKEQTGVNFLSYIINLRMGKAKDMLLDKSTGIAEIAEAVGYQNVHSFRRAFKRVLGISPSEYRNTVSTAKTDDSARMIL